MLAPSSNQISILYHFACQLLESRITGIKWISFSPLRHSAFIGSFSYQNHAGLVLFAAPSSAPARNQVMMNIPRSIRSLASRPVFPAVAVATLALGLGVNAAIFSLTREVLLRPLPYRDAGRLVRVFEVSRTLGVASAPTAPRIIRSFPKTSRRNAFKIPTSFAVVAD